MNLEKDYPKVAELHELEDTQGIERENVPDTLAHVVKLNGVWRVATGMELATSKEFDTKEEAIAWVQSKPYEMIIAMTLYAINLQTSIIKANEEQNKKGDNYEG